MSVLFSSKEIQFLAHFSPCDSVYHVPCKYSIKIYSGFDFVVFRCKYLIYKLIAGILKFIAMKDVTI